MLSASLGGLWGFDNASGAVGVSYNEVSGSALGISGTGDHHGRQGGEETPEGTEGGGENVDVDNS